jgi:hypothetical protein
MAGVFLGNVVFLSTVTVNYDANVTNTNTTQEAFVTVPGVLPGDFVMVNKPSNSPGIGIVNARVSAANTVGVTYGNFTGSAVNPPAENYLFCVIRPDSVTGTAQA